MKKKKLRCYIYVRVSTSMQVDGYSLEAQRERLLRFAEFQEMEVADVEGYFKGPTAVALVKEDANEVAKILFDFAKDAPALHVKGALIEKEIYDEAKIEAFSKLPGKKQLISMIMSAINGPVQKVAATLQAYIEKMEAGEKS